VHDLRSSTWQRQPSERGRIPHASRKDGEGRNLRDETEAAERHQCGSLGARGIERTAELQGADRGDGGEEALDQSQRPDAACTMSLEGANCPSSRQ